MRPKANGRQAARPLRDARSPFLPIASSMGLNISSSIWSCAGNKASRADQSSRCANTSLSADQSMCGRRSSTDALGLALFLVEHGKVGIFIPCAATLLGHAVLLHILRAKEPLLGCRCQIARVSAQAMHLGFGSRPTRANQKSQNCCVTLTTARRLPRRMLG